ncbi:MAG: hypothetical protein Q8O89_06525, partial [Nanoarchaeota archaeon]|nr:hypothetical protein [Nanoarchaeota archaeon]
MDEKIIEEAAEIAIRDGRPCNGIKYIHKKVLEAVAKNSKIIADGVRRNDRVPALSLSEITSFEDKFKVHYIQPLMGYSRKTISILLKKYFLVKEDKSSSSPTEPRNSGAKVKKKAELSSPTEPFAAA